MTKETLKRTTNNSTHRKRGDGHNVNLTPDLPDCILSALHHRPPPNSTVARMAGADHTADSGPYEISPTDMRFQDVPPLSFGLGLGMPLPIFLHSGPILPGIPHDAFFPPIPPSTTSVLDHLPSPDTTFFQYCPLLHNSDTSPFRVVPTRKDRCKSHESTSLSKIPLLGQAHSSLSCKFKLSLCFSHFL